MKCFVQWRNDLPSEQHTEGTAFCSSKGQRRLSESQLGMLSRSCPGSHVTTNVLAQAGYLNVRNSGLVAKSHLVFRCENQLRLGVFCQRI
jgi:hypothetical protein